MVTRRLRSLFLLLALLLITSAGPVVQSAPMVVEQQTTPGNAQSGSSPFAAVPNEIAVSVPLGQQQQVTLTLENQDSVSHTPRLYEARSAPPAGVVSRLVLPESLRRVALPEQSTRVDAQLQRDLAESPDGRTEFLVFLDEQPDLAAAYSITDWGERGRFVSQTLSENAERTQRDIRAWLEQRGLPYRPFWIANAIAVRGTAADVQALAERADVALLRANHILSLSVVDEEAVEDLPGAVQRTVPSSCAPDDDNICWNIRKIGADRVWYDFGVSGEGITVANIDSGVQYDHPALAQQYRGYRGTGSFQHDYNWFDPRGIAPEPQALGNHGTHTMGTMVARGTTDPDQPAVGVAPGARWIAARGCQEVSCSEADLMAAAQWLLNPTDVNGNNPRPDLRPHIVNNSWADSAGGNEKYAGYTTAWRAAGMFPVFAAGNNRHATCSTVTSPGDYANVVGTGATDQNDQIAYFSSVGPSFEGELKPDIAAPGQGIASTFAGNDLSYGSLQGTSMAAPHVAATVALMWSANPALIGDYDATYAVLTQSAVPRTDVSFNGSQYLLCRADSVPNNVYGYGRLDAYAAVAQATVDVPWLRLPASVPAIGSGATRSVTMTLDAARVPGPGTYDARVLVHTADLTRSPLVVEITLTVTAIASQAAVSGSIRDEETGTPLTGMVEIDGGPVLSVPESGEFSVILPARSEPYTLTARAMGYVSVRTEILLDAGVASTVNFSLVPDLPRLRVDVSTRSAMLAFGETKEFTTVLENTGTQPISYTLEVPSEWFGIWGSDAAGGPASTWLEPPPADRVTLELNDDGSSGALPIGFAFPFYGKQVKEIYLSANGFLSIAPLPINQPFSQSCLPIPESFTAAIVPLRADLDPAQGGTVSYAQTGEGFVVTFEDVPLHDQPNDVFTFQVVLKPDGRILFNYKQLATVPRSAAVGVQRSVQDAQTVGCGLSAPLADGLTLELRPQPNAQFWLDAPKAEGSIPPGKEAEVAIRVNWVGPNPMQPYRSALLVYSNDPRQSLVRLPVELTTTRAPHEIWLLFVGNTTRP